MIKISWYMSFSHVIPVVSVVLSCDTNCINGSIFFIRWTQLKQGVTWHLVMWCFQHQCEHHMILMALSMAQFWFVWTRWLKHGGTQLFRHVIPVLVSHDTDVIINSTIAFVSSKLSKRNATWLFQSFSTGISIMWCQWHCQYHHCIH